MHPQLRTAPHPQQQQREHVTFCSIDRVGAQAFLVVCTTHTWQVYRLDRFTSARDTLTPVQIALEDKGDSALLTNVRLLRLFHLPVEAQDAVSTEAAGRGKSPHLAGFFVSERCNEVDYTHHSQPADRSSDPAAWPVTEGSEDLTVFSFVRERIQKQLPPTPSSVVDVQIQRSTAAVLCESHEIQIVDLRTMTIRQRIQSLSSLSMALGPRWLAYPGFASGTLDNDSDSEDADEVVPEALVGGGSRRMLQSERSSLASSSPSYNAIDVAQNVASGIYYLSKSIAPYLSSSPGAVPGQPQGHASPPYGSSGSTTGEPPHAHHHTASPTAPYAGWVVVHDLWTDRVVANFKTHATALVNLAFDVSGCLLATSSTKGQNVHVYRLLPPLQTQSATRSPPARQQLLYKLQRGITHASIADLSFSQDSKWLNVTSAHGTSHLYAIHPEGRPLRADTHVTHPTESASTASSSHSQVNDFCESFRAIETQTVARVLKIHHQMEATGLAGSSTEAAALGVHPLSLQPSGSASVSTASSSASFPGYPAAAYSAPPATTTFMGSALDASQALLSQLAQSTTSSLPRVELDFGLDELDLTGRRLRRRRRLSCLFASDGLKMVIYCDGVLKLYDLLVRATPPPDSTSGGKPRQSYRLGGLTTGSSSDTLTSKTRSSGFGFDATVTERRTWELGASPSPRYRAESLSANEGSATVEPSSSSPMATRSCYERVSSELRTFQQHELPMWAHPKVSFRAMDADHPEGRRIQVKRKGPSQDIGGGHGHGHGALQEEQQLFVLEMDSYFGLGGSPVFDGQPDPRVSPEVPSPPPLALSETINLAMSTSLTGRSAVAEEEEQEEEGEEGEASVAATAKASRGKAGGGNKRGKRKKGRAPSPPSPSPSAGSGSTSASNSPPMLHFTLQDMYFATPEKEVAGEEEEEEAAAWAM